MVELDVEFVKKCMRAGLLKSPCLELGAGYSGPNNRQLIQDAEIAYFGTDISQDSAVDYVINFEDPPEVINRNVEGGNLVRSSPSTYLNLPLIPSGCLTTFSAYCSRRELV